VKSARLERSPLAGVVKDVAALAAHDAQGVGGVEEGEVGGHVLAAHAKDLRIIVFLKPLLELTGCASRVMSQDTVAHGSGLRRHDSDNPDPALCHHP
jgi:hypothetical protein